MDLKAVVKPNPSHFHLRLFLESICNLRCTYCNPDAERAPGGRISNEELTEFIEAGAELGVRRVHYTGGEPTLRKGLESLMRTAKKSGYAEQVMTTNAVLLAPRLDEYVAAGLSRITISLDTFDRERYARMTGRDALEDVLAGIQRARELLGTLRLNTVVTQENVEEIPALIDFATGKSIIPRFIELQTNQAVFYKGDEPFDQQYVPAARIVEGMRERGLLWPTNVNGENPNCAYFMVGTTGVVAGIIANHSRGYPCGDCRKLRVSPYGDLGVCINAEGLSVLNTTYEQKRDALALSMQRREELNRLLLERKHVSRTYGFWRWGDLRERQTARVVQLS